MFSINIDSSTTKKSQCLECDKKLTSETASQDAAKEAPGDATMDLSANDLPQIGQLEGQSQQPFMFCAPNPIALPPLPALSAPFWSLTCDSFGGMAFPTPQMALFQQQLEQQRQQQLISSTPLYKTELCRSFQELGICKYGDRCQFAHGILELRNLNRHPKYKTEYCRTFCSNGYCPYGARCHFIHSSDEVRFMQQPQTQYLFIFTNTVNQMSGAETFQGLDDTQAAKISGTQQIAQILDSTVMPESYTHTTPDSEVDGKTAMLPVQVPATPIDLSALQQQQLQQLPMNLDLTPFFWPYAFPSMALPLSAGECCMPMPSGEQVCGAKAETDDTTVEIGPSNGICAYACMPFTAENAATPVTPPKPIDGGAQEEQFKEHTTTTMVGNTSGNSLLGGVLHEQRH